MSDAKGRMMPPSQPISRAHTPQPSLLSQTSDPAGADDVQPRLSFSSTLSSVSSLPDLKKASAKPTKRPKFVARASQYLIGTYGKPAKEPNFWDDPKPKQEEHQSPLEQVINSLQIELLSNPLKSLGVQRNSSLLRVLESYTSLQKERDLLKKQLDDVVARHDKNVDMLEEERRDWKQDEENFRAEIKRLEVMIAEGKTGLSQVALARQQSMIRPRGAGRPRKDSSKSEAAQSFASTGSSKSSKEIKFEDIRRPTTPSLGMQDLSKNFKAHRSFLSLDFFPERPPSRLKGISLADVDVPKHRRKRSEATSQSVASSPAESFSSDFSSDGGDLLPHELEQQELDQQAVRHVAKMMAAAHGTEIDGNVQVLRRQLADRNYLLEPNDRTPRPKTKNLAQRRGNEVMHINTENEAPSVTSSGHSRRPFSFYAGDDKTIMNNPRTAPPKLSHDYSDSSVTSESEAEEADLPLRRHSSLIPGPVPEHVLARPRREDSSSSVITSLQRSPLGDAPSTGSSRPVSAVALASGGSSGSLTRVSSVSILSDRTNDRARPLTPRVGSATRTASVRSTLTAVRGQASVQSLVKDLEGKGKGKEKEVDAQVGGEKEKMKDKKPKKEAKKRSPKAGKKDKAKKEN